MTGQATPRSWLAGLIGHGVGPSLTPELHERAAQRQGLRYVYRPLVSRNSARKSALRHVVETFFDGSAEKAVAALLGGEASRLNEEELERIADLIARTRKEGPR